MRPRFDAVLFDVDGTLLDSTEFVVNALRHALQTHGLPVPSASAVARIMGPPLAECYQRVAPGHDPAPLIATHRAWQREHVHLIQAYPGAADALRRLRAAGVRLAAVTARSRVSSLGTLDSAGLASLLEFTISAEDTARPKPYPDPLHLALDRLGVSPPRAAMVGDTVTDIEAGRAAGVVTVAALYGFAGESLAGAGADHCIRAVEEVVPIVLAP